jgi:hypothetical protein
MGLHSVHETMILFLVFFTGLLSFVAIDAKELMASYP